MRDCACELVINYSSHGAKFPEITLLLRNNNLDALLDSDMMRIGAFWILFSLREIRICNWSRRNNQQQEDEC